VCAWIWFSEIKYSQLKINHLNNTPSTKAAGGGISVVCLTRTCTTQGQEDFELSWYLFFQQHTICKFHNKCSTKYKISLYKTPFQASEYYSPTSSQAWVLVIQSSVAAYLQDSPSRFFSYDLLNARKRRNHY
jgi:hypothetical protein